MSDKRGLHKVSLPASLREDVITVGRDTVGSGAELMREAIAEYAAEAPDGDGSEIVDFVFAMSDDDTWAKAQARAHREGIKLSHALRPILREKVRK